MTIFDWSALAVLSALLLFCVHRLVRREPVRDMLEAVLPAAVGCIIAACAGRSGHPVLAAMIGVATLIHILYVVRPAAMRNTTPAGGREP